MEIKEVKKLFKEEFDKFACDCLCELASNDVDKLKGIVEDYSKATCLACLETCCDKKPADIFDEMLKTEGDEDLSKNKKTDAVCERFAKVAKKIKEALCCEDDDCDDCDDDSDDSDDEEERVDDSKKSKKSK